MELNWEYDKKAKAAFSGDFINAETLGGLLKEVLAVSVGPGKIMQTHLRKGQGTWKRPTAKTLRDKRKISKRTFVWSRRVEKAITTRVKSGDLTTWGSSADIYSTTRSKAPKRYSANGLYAQIKIANKSASIRIGFSGTMKHSAAFNRARRELAIKRGANLKGLSSRDRDKVIRKHASVGDVERAFGGKKWAAKGSTGIKGGKHVLARETNNLAHANIMQRGVFKGIKTKGGHVYNPKALAAARRRGTFHKGELTYGVARPLMPYTSEDESVIMPIINNYLTDLCKRLS